MEKKEIPLSKGKNLLLIIGSSAFVAAGYWMVTSLSKEHRRYSPEFIQFAGIAGMAFFGMILIYAIWKLFDTKPGLIIDKNGLTDNASAVAAGFIEWKDITGIRTAQIQTTKFLLIDTTEPEKYLSRQNKLKAATMRLNMKMYGTPVSISSSALKCNFNDLEKMVITAFEESRQQ